MVKLCSLINKKMMKIFMVLLSVMGMTVGLAQGPAKKLVAKTYNSGFSIAHDTYNAISAASDGKIYYVLSSQSIDTGGQM